MRAREAEVVDAVWAAAEPRLPSPDRSHLLSYHRPGISDRFCPDVTLIRPVTGCSWVDVEGLVRGAGFGAIWRARQDE